MTKIERPEALTEGASKLRQPLPAKTQIMLERLARARAVYADLGHELDELRAKLKVVENTTRGYKARLETTLKHHKSAMDAIDRGDIGACQSLAGLMKRA